jgi:glycosyltransferase involved in cell wall biosynthesis
LERYKGVQHAIRALTDLPEYDLVVAGAGPYGDELRQIAREVGVGDRVEFAGYVPDDDLPELYAGAVAFLSLSSFEAYGITIAESLAAGTPCVVREAGALIDWVEREDCIGVNLNEVVAGIRDAVDRQAPAEPLPSWEDVIRQVEAIYKEVR